MKLYILLMKIKQIFNCLKLIKDSISTIILYKILIQIMIILIMKMMIIMITPTKSILIIIFLIYKK